jgi:hypothetical protein
MPADFEFNEVRRDLMKQHSFKNGSGVLLSVLSMQAIGSLADEKWQHPAHTCIPDSTAAGSPLSLALRKASRQSR